jgi:hypothetical protein
VLAHAVVNAVVNAALYHVVEPLTEDTGRRNWLATETGLVYGVVLLLAARWQGVAADRSGADADDLQVGVGHEDAG